ncbi:triose-phosphate isomerase [Chloroflexota bacterium]
MRKPLIAGNWKMNTNITEAVTLVQSMLPKLDTVEGVDKVICPPYISLDAIKKCIEGTSVKLGAQNMYFKEKGAFTGEISVNMLTGLCEFVILGHSERRQYFAETDELINNKIKAAFQAGITPILCVGESLEENEAGRTQEILTRQVTMGLADIEPDSQLIIAYEPIWAIGTGKAASGQQANNTIAIIRSTVAALWKEMVASEIRILYGGSVTGANIAEFIAESDIDGALVGGASLKADDFLSIINQTSEIKAAK